MIEPVDPRLDDAILAEPTAVEPRRVLADFLEGHGHPRAELIRLDIEKKDTKDWFARHRDIAGFLGNGVAAHWRFGYADELTLTNVHDVALDTLWPTIATHRSYRFLRELTLVRSMHMDSKLPPPDGIRRLYIFYGGVTMRWLATVPWPRVTTLTLDQHMKHPTLDAALLAAALPALPVLENLDIEKCLDGARVEALVVQLARSPQRLRRLSIDRLTETAARTLIDSKLQLHLVTANETIAAKTRDQLRRAMRSWKAGTVEPPAKHATRKPEKAPADFASMPPVTKVDDQNGWRIEWAGSGVSLYDHPVGAHGSAACAACGGTNTLVIWARDEHAPSYSGWGPDSRAIDYELVCRECERFTCYAATGY